MFQDRAPWWGGDLQTLRNMCVRRRDPLPSHASTLLFPMADGSGDQLMGKLEQPLVPSTTDPLIVLIHGLTGCEDSDYMRQSARFHLARGRRVLRLNLRGAGPSRPLSQGLYHAGCADDIEGVLSGLDARHTQHGLFLVGYSLGGNVLLNWLGRAETRHRVIGAATVSAPIEPSQACARMMKPRNALYHRFLLQRMRKDVLDFCDLSALERREVERAPRIFEFDDKWVAPRNGFRDAADYYRRTAGAQFVPAIDVPALMMHAHNDPWIPIEPYLSLKKIAPPHVSILLPRSGGHLGFHERKFAEPWHDRRIDGFIRTLRGDVSLAPSQPESGLAEAAAP